MGCSPHNPSGATIPLSSEVVASLEYVVDYPKGEIAVVKMALSALDGQLALKEATNVYIQNAQPEIEVIFYPVPDWSKGGPDGLYTAKVFINAKSLKVVRIEIPGKK